MYAIGTGLLCPWLRVSTNAFELAFVPWFNCPNGWQARTTGQWSSHGKPQPGLATYRFTVGMSYPAGSPASGCPASVVTGSFCSDAHRHTLIHTHAHARKQRIGAKWCVPVLQARPRVETAKWTAAILSLTQLAAKPGRDATTRRSAS